MKQGLSQTTKLKQNQTLVNIQQLTVTSRILSLNIIDMANEIFKEVNDNSLLEFENDKIIKDIDQLLKSSDNNTNYNNSPDFSSSYGTADDDDKNTIIEKTYPFKKSLIQYLFEQLSKIKGDLSDKEYNLAVTIILSIDNNGFIRDYSLTKEEEENGTPWENLINDLLKDGIKLQNGKNDTVLNVTIEEIENVRNIIKKFDPIGIGTKNWRESSIVQLTEKNISKEHVAYKILNNAEDEKVANCILAEDYKSISTLFHCEINTIKDAVKLIKSLNIPPAIGYKEEETENINIYPDIEIKKVTHYLINHFGEKEPVINFEISSNYKKSGIFNYHINEQLLQEMKNEFHKFTDKEKQFVNKQIERAKFMINYKQFAPPTIELITKTIVDFQKEYFLSGDTNDLKPLNQDTIAKEVELTAGTVSRTIGNKYLLFEEKIIPFADLFPNGYSSNSSENDISDYKVKKVIKDIIENENKAKPLSDDKIKEIVRSKLGINIARRTINKYREIMGIPSSSKRRIKNK